jgi:hypothetical protein
VTVGGGTAAEEPGGSGTEGDGDSDELGEPAWPIRPLGGGLLGEMVASDALFELSLAVPLIVPELASSAPAAQISTITTTAVPTVAMARRRRYTDGGRDPCGSSTSGK